MVEQRTAELLEVNRALRDVSVLQRAVLDSANYAIISTDEEGVIRTFNTGAEALTGYKACEVVGAHTPLLFHDPDEMERFARALSLELGVQVPPTMEYFAQMARLGQTRDFECLYRRRDGSLISVLLSLSQICDEDGTTKGLLGILCDISERKRTEEHMRMWNALSPRAARA
jgi:two-component system sensor histidine kinase/response regulator